MENGKTTSNKKEVSEKSQLEAIRMQLQALLELNKQREEENKKLQGEILQLKEEAKTKPADEAKVVEEEPVKTASENFDANRMVEIVHLADRAEGLSTVLEMADGRRLTFRRYGDSIRVRYYEFQQLLSTYDSMFRKDRVFTLGKNDQDIAEAEHLPTFDEKCLSKDEVRGLLQLSPKRLEEVYNRVCDTQKELILSAWQRGYYAGEDSEYRNLDKINALNKVSGNRLRTVYENLTQPINS